MSAEEQGEEAVYRFVARNYDRFRLAVLNEDYYAARCATFSKRNQRLQFSGGLFAALAAITAAPALGLPELLPVSLAALASLIGFLLPFSRLQTQIEHLERLHIGYTLLRAHCETLLSDSVRQAKIDELLLGREEELLKMRVSLQAADEPALVDERLRDRIDKRVRERYPPEHVWSM